MKRIISIIITIALVVSLLLVTPKNVYAADATVNISLTTNTTSVIVGQDVEVTINISSNIEMLFAEFMLNYDSTKFDFVSADGVGGSAYAGVIPFNMDYPINMNAIGQATSYQYKVILKAKATADATDISVSDVVVTGCDTNIEEHYLTPTIKNITGIKIWAQGSDDATLSTLQVVGFSLNPAFGKWTTDYIVYVDSNTTAVDIVAQATQAAQGGRVEISGHTTDLAFGNNYVTVKSFAPNGKVITYNINIYRLDPPTEAPTTEPPTEPPAWSEVVVEGNSYNISADFTADMIPAGFTSTIYDYKGNEALGVVNTKLGLDMLYLVDGEQNGKFFIYDKTNNSFYPYLVIYALDNGYVVLPNSLAETIPSDTKEGTFIIGENEIKGFIDNNDKNFSYFYAVNLNGGYSWYSYDALEGTIQRFHSVSVVAPTDKEDETTADATEPSNEVDTSNNYASENESLLAENGNLTKIRNIFFAIAVVLFIVLLALIIVLLTHKSEEKHSKKIEKVDYVKAEKEIDAKEADAASEAEMEIPENIPEAEDIASVYEAAIMKQMAATKEDTDDVDDVDDSADDEVGEEELSEEENEELESIAEEDLDDVDLTDTTEMEPVVVPETTTSVEAEDLDHPEIISLDDEEDLL